MRQIPRPSKEEMAKSWVHPVQRQQSIDEKVTIIRYVIPAMPGFIQGGMLLGAKPRRVVQAHFLRGGVDAESTWYEEDENGG